MGSQPATPTTPIIVRQVPPASQTGVADVLLGSVGLAGALLLGALIGGLLVGLVIVTLKRWRDRHRTSEPDSELVRLNLSQ